MKENSEKYKLSPKASEGESDEVENIINKLENNIKLTKEELSYMVNGYTKGKIKDKEMSKFLLLIKEKGLSYEETFFLTDAMVQTGDILDLSHLGKTIVDKHSTGGVGDKLTIIVSPIVASLGLGIAKMSGRSLGFTGGTIDKLESIPGYTTSLSNLEFENLVRRVGIGVISQTGSLAPSDKKIYALRDEIGAVESIPLIASSIMSKKIASGSPNIVIDLKVGKGAFIKDTESAKTLAEYMIKIGEYFNRKVVCILTDMDTPLGNTVGNSIEIKEAENFFLGKREKRLNELVISLASNMVSLGKNISLEEAKQQVITVLDNGLAKAKFYEWINAQGGNIRGVSLAKNKLTIRSSSKGYISSIDPIKTAWLLKDLGAGRKNKEDNIDLTVGMAFIHTINESVEEGTPLINIFYNKPIDNLESRAKEIVKIESILQEPKDIIISVIK